MIGINKLISFLRTSQDYYKAFQGQGEVLWRFQKLRGIGAKILPEYRFKWPQMEWWSNANFNAYLSKFNDLHSMDTDRRWMLYQLMRLVESVPGDTAECGVYRGAGSYLICYINSQCTSYKREHFIFDSFEGLSQPLTIDGEYWTKGDLNCSLEMVKGNLSEFNNFQLYQGWIPDRFSEIKDKNFAFVHIDVDLYQPTKDSLEFFYNHTNYSGIILCDDYGFTSCPGATKAIDEFLADKPEKMISLSAGGGFLIKGKPTSGIQF